MPRRPRTRATSTRRPHRRRKPKPWPKRRSIRRRAKKTPGGRSKSTDLHFRHCEERSDKAIHGCDIQTMDCFASLAMTALGCREPRMTIRRREFLTLAGATALSPALPRLACAADSTGAYDLPRFGNARILHMTDTHAQLKPVYFREPSVNLGIGAMAGQPPHLVGRTFLDRFGVKPDSADAYAFTSLDFENSAARFGKLGGFAHLKTLIDRLRSEVGPGRPLLLDGDDLCQGTGIANALEGADMVEAANLLGIEAMTGHWEFTYGEEALRANLARFK